MHAIAAINFHRSFKHWRILPRKFLSSWIDRWAAAVLGAHTAWFALKLSKELYKWFISDVNFTGRLTFLQTCFMNSDSRKFVREKENNLVFVLGRRKRNADYAQRSNQRPLSGYDYFAWWSSCISISRKNENILALLQNKFLSSIPYLNLLKVTL